ncbi:MAG: membrane-bound lytic murein transglycosylase MltF, partial [Pseudomonadota bacterium]
RMRFTSPYQEITEQVVYRSGNSRPRSPKHLTSGLLEVVKGTSHIGTLKKLKAEIPELDWIVNNELDTDSLLYLVNAGLVDYTVADSNQVKLIRRFYPELKVAFDISEPRPLAWAMTKSDDDSLYREAERFFDQIKRKKTLAALIDKHYGHTNSLSYVGNYTFRQHVKTRLPKFRRWFQKSAAKLGVDWRLLAAIGYQESHWDKKAVSPTGVRGIMMLTEDTAKLMGIDNREDPIQSINGGARYFVRSKKRIPNRIADPDRTWLALAAYNVGFGHLEDARMLTKQFGGDPDKWLDVRRHLPLLTKKAWYSKTKYGYARGREPVRYVENIRGYYDLLVWLTEENTLAKNALKHERQEDIEQPKKFTTPPGEMDIGALAALAITNPVL